MAEKQSEPSWWGYASNAWSSIQETAKDFTDSLQAENKETIEQIKETVDSEKISHQISNATNSINTFLNTTLQSMNTDGNTNSSNINKPSKKKQISPKPFEKERATYASDPCSMQQHKEKYNKFIEKELGLNDDEICLKGRQLLEINSAIRAYFEQLVPNDLDEVIFWKRYFYWKYQTQLREILISRHTETNEQQQIDIKQDDDEEDEEDEVQLGDCENAKINDHEIHNQDGNGMDNDDKKKKKKENKKEVIEEKKSDCKGNKNGNRNRNNNGNGTTDEQSSTSDGGSGGKFSETSWMEVSNASNTNITNTEESIANIVISDGDKEKQENDKQGNDVEEHEEVEDIELDNDENVKDDKNKDINEENGDKNEGNDDIEEDEEDWADWD